ncbi:nucleic acid-binding protein [Methanoplanus endosymbiosus]|uniref:Nucleic acid-binding protein n=1 Tax=Methanoplanus endosymbiosus TaxID=33865 RepID=A0A9E7PJQ5_9EURY|nr:nucleic acid-binding protein [Methanoplanus endosymbiosus]UUX91205.1 nucleic acid-binding protein [Methanoplanus endosymbiosus]
MKEKEGQSRNFEREPAKRVFATELREARVQFKESTDDMSPSYIMLPTGERCNRIFFCGELKNKEKRGDQNVFYTARVKDATGLFFINAGSYQQEAMLQMTSLENDSYVAVTGKPIIKETQDGGFFVSVRVESISAVDDETYRLWLDDTAKATLDRIEIFGETEDSAKAGEFYSTDIKKYLKITYNALAGENY